MNKLLIIAVMVTLLALSAESFRVARQVLDEEPGTLAKITDTIKTYYGDSVDAATGYIDSIRGMKLEEKAKNLYDETTKVVSTYFNVFHDQIYYSFYPQ
ncbi:hypothetical protein NHX12_001903 [Muraenolepis orangiensis]|uniref:Apolipoprotein C-II n=1 Tax=Muraenolepis orangiensis TaxID=630683 RepID=A0A9Q0IHP8_9TELE|nr:hypothetical protein NHX12_001903 [Muraenolepis orangiensis]